MPKRPLMFIDFETDGLKVGEAVPTQCALIYYDQYERKSLASHEFLIHPPKGHELNKAVLAKTGVTYEDAMSGISIKESCKLIQDFVRECGGGKMTKGNKPTIVAHNAPFDVSFMQYLFTESKQDIAKTFDSQNGVVGYLCTQRMFLNVTSNPELKYEGATSLGAMCDYYDVSLLNAHSALADTKATMECWEKMTSGSQYEKEEVTTTKSLKRKRKHFQI